MSSTDVRSTPTLAGRQLRDAIRDAVQKRLDLDRYQLFVFGSEASGVADRRSDIDVGILGPHQVPGPTMQAIRDELDTLRTLRAFDVVDLRSVGEQFKVKALEHAERL